jgi:hypothetical protein
MQQQSGRMAEVAADCDPTPSAGVLGRMAEREDARMPAKSKKQQMAAGAALAAKRGEAPRSRLKGASKSMAASMSEKELRDLASARRKDLPERKPDS